MQALKATLAADVNKLDKKQTRELCEKATNRAKKMNEETKKEEGGIDDAQFDPYFNQMPPVEEGKEGISFEDALEAILLYCVDEQLIPTRLATALKAYKDEFVQPERQIYDFF